MFLNKLLNKGYQADQCEICSIQFNLIKLERIHKCKRCNKFICGKCGKHRQKIIDENGIWTKQIHRICVLCKKDFMEIHQTIMKNGMQWNRDTPMSKSWLINMQNIINDYSYYQYEHFLQIFNQNPSHYKEETQIIYKDVIKGRTDSSVYNFSMREFFYSVKLDVQDQVSRENVKNVLYAIAARYYNVGYCQGMSGIAAFILCFASQKTAFMVFCDLLQNILPQDLFLDSEYGQSLSGLMAESFFLQEYFIHLLCELKKPLIECVRGCFYSQAELLHFRTVIQLMASKVILSLFVGIVSFSICIFIWHQLKQHRSFQVVQRAFLAMIYMNRQKIIQNRSFKVIEQEVQRMNLEEFKQFYFDIEIDQEMRKKLLQKHYENMKKRWNPKSDHHVKNLIKVTKFSEKQILKIKESFPESQHNISILNQHFIKFVRLFYDSISNKKNSKFIQLYREQNIKIIVDNFYKHNQNGLDLKQFLICLSLCIKNKFIVRFITLISVLKDENNLISEQKLLSFLQNITTVQSQPKDIKNKWVKFNERVKKYAGKNGRLSMKILQPLLNDNYVHSLAQVLQFQTQSTLIKIIQQTKKVK